MVKRSDTERYSRQLLLPEYGPKAQEQVMKKSVLIVGAGGLGCPLALYLAGAGVKHLGIVDDDVVERGNLHRQIAHTDEGAVNRTRKVESLIASVRALNPSIKCTAIIERFNSDNAQRIINGYTVVADCTDNVTARYFINDACVMNQIPLVSGAAVAFDGQLSVYNYDGGPCYRCVNPLPPSQGAAGSCSSNGVLGPVPGVIGTLMAIEVLKIIGMFGDPLRQKLCIFDGFSGRFRTIKLPKRCENCAVCSKRGIRSMSESKSWADKVGIGNAGGCEALQIGHVMNRITNEASLPNMNKISCEEFSKKYNNLIHEYVLIDVRVRSQFAICRLDDSLNIPLTELKNNLDKIRVIQQSKEKTVFKTNLQNQQNQRLIPIFIICRRGINSQLGARILINNGFEKFGPVYHIIGGLLSWAEEVDNLFPIY